MGRGSARLIGLALICLLAAGCGGDDNFTAAGFVEQVNDQGVQMRLGPQLSDTGSRTLYEIRLIPLPGQPPPAPGEHEGPPGRGTLYVFDGSDGAKQQLEACRGSGGLACYRANNVVTVFESISLESERLGVAIRRMAG
jgi:hypothetical protein